MTFLTRLRTLIINIANSKRQLAAHLTALGIPASAKEPLSALVGKVAELGKFIKKKGDSNEQ